MSFYVHNYLSVCVPSTGLMQQNDFRAGNFFKRKKIKLYALLYPPYILGPFGCLEYAPTIGLRKISILQGLVLVAIDMDEGKSKSPRICKRRRILFHIS